MVTDSIPREDYLRRRRPGGETRPWEQAVRQTFRQLGLSREDAETLRRCCGLMERASRKKNRPVVRAALWPGPVGEAA